MMTSKNNIELQMAPFQGITTFVFRSVYVRYFEGVDKFFTPFFTNINKENLNPSRAKELTVTSINNIPLVPQILSNNADEILRFARFVKSLGFEEINWNLGCPFPRVAKKKRGSGLLPYSSEIKYILDKVTKKIPLKISIKARLGYEDAKEMSKLISVLNRYDISELTIHARIGKQLYKGEVLINDFKDIASVCKLRLGYNGDIFTVQDKLSFSSIFPQIDLIMLGRGMLIDPLLPSKIKGIYENDNNEQKLLIRSFIDTLYFEYRKYFENRLTSLNVLKEYWWYLSHSFDNPTKVFKTIKKIKTFDEYEDGVNKVFEYYDWVGESGDFFRKTRVLK